MTEYALPSGKTISYPNLVAALAKPGDAILETLTGDKAHAWHMASCVPGEAGELVAPLADYAIIGAQIDRDNVIEELGDIEFYVQGLCEPLGIDRDVPATVCEPIRTTNLAYITTLLARRAAEVFDATKKWVIYNKALDRAALEKAVADLDLVMFAIRFHFGITRDAVLAANVLKLGQRYDQLSYSDAAAQARADKTVH